MEIQKIETFFTKKPARGIFRPPFAIQALLLTSQTLSWLKIVLSGPYAWFQGATAPMWMSLAR